MVGAAARAAAVRRRVRPLVSLGVDMRDVYAATHWASTGRPPGVPHARRRRYLPGRNIVLLGKAGVYCAAAGIDRLVIGTLAHNPFPDATPEFRAAMAARALARAGAPARDRRAVSPESAKAEVIRRGAALGVPLELTLSCMNPRLPQPSALRHQPFTAVPARSAASATTPSSRRALPTRRHTPPASTCAEEGDRDPSRGR